MHQANGVRHCSETQTKYGRSPVGWRGKGGLQEHTEQENCRFNNSASSHLQALSPKAVSAEHSRSPRDRGGSKPRPFYIPFPCSFCQDLPPQGWEWLWRAHSHKSRWVFCSLATKTSVPLLVQLSSCAVLSYPSQCSGTRDIHTNNTVPLSCHHWHFSKDTEGLP